MSNSISTNKRKYVRGLGQCISFLKEPKHWTTGAAWRVGRREISTRTAARRAYREHPDEFRACAVGVYDLFMNRNSKGMTDGSTVLNRISQHYFGAGIISVNDSIDGRRHRHNTYYSLDTRTQRRKAVIACFTVERECIKNDENLSDPYGVTPWTAPKYAMLVNEIMGQDVSSTWV